MFLNCYFAILLKCRFREYEMVTVSKSNYHISFQHPVTIVDISCYKTHAIADATDAFLVPEVKCIRILE